MNLIVFAVSLATYCAVGVEIGYQFCKRTSRSLGGQIGHLDNTTVAMVAIYSFGVGVAWPVFVPLWLIYRIALLFAGPIRRLAAGDVAADR